jgi:membrane glycosyltransferase
LSADTSLDGNYVQWAEDVKRRGFTSLVLTLLDVLQAWQELSVQLLWLASPLVGSESLDPWIVALEDPQVMHSLRRALEEEGGAQP